VNNAKLQTSHSGDVMGNYNESLTYDKNGNIQSLQRNGGEENPLLSTPIDNLSYFYDAQNKNLLLKVVDLTNSSQGFKDDGTGTLASDTNDDYRYDLNGNMTYDENKNITNIVYNHLNLPIQIEFGTGSNIVYMYDATGAKLKKVVNTYSPIQPTISVTEYINGFQYNNNVMQFFPTSEGYVNCTMAANIMYYNYVYNYTDHLGNIRMSYTWDEGIQGISVLEEHHYYPFGLEHNGYNSAKKEYEAKLVEVTLPEGGKISIFKPRVIQVVNSGYQYQYNGKEWQDELGLNWYDYQARNYDPALGRWFNIDPASEVSRRFSPYTYALDNPVFFIDPDGMIAEGFGVDENDWKKNGDGTYTAQKGDSAVTLAQDANISPKKANEIIETQLGPNYKRKSDGMLMSDVEVGDVVAVPEQVDKSKEIQKLEKSIDKDKSLIKQNKNEIVKLKDTKKQIDDDHKLNVEVGAYEAQQGDDGKGLKFAKTIIEYKIAKRKAKLDSQIDKKNNTIDSLNKEIKKKENKIKN
jgi:RHS repeat-associated protein